MEFTQETIDALQVDEVAIMNRIAKELSCVNSINSSYEKTNIFTRS
ncbi:MAG TPA: hypothetical protein VLZ44_07620 [Treponemataceae bacterium]|nr:hypothetical protein [Treponemataceae bacterium]